MSRFVISAALALSPMVIGGPSAVAQSPGSDGGSVPADDPLPPGNDNFASAFEIPGPPCTGTVEQATCAGSTVGATEEPDEPRIFATDAGRSVWYRWTAPDRGTLEVDLEGSWSFSMLGLYSGQAFPLTVLGESSTGFLPARVEVEVELGARIEIQIDGHLAGPVGNYVLNVNFDPYRCPGYESSTLNPVVGGDGDDTLVGTVAADVICGLDGNDTLIGMGGNDILLGGDGMDTLIGGGGHDVLNGGPGDDGSFKDFGAVGLFGGAGNDRLVGGPGNDHLFGGMGADRLVAGPGEDVLLAHAGGDTLLGGDGDDLLLGGPGNDVVNGGYTFDCADYELDAGPVTASLVTRKASGAGIGTDTLTGIDCLIGTARGDHLTGNASGNTLWGLDGNDTLIGLDGNDFLHGWGGFDTLNGGLHYDLCLVGKGGGTRTGCEQNTLVQEQRIGGAGATGEIFLLATLAIPTGRG
ncbi:MAG: hypothetical protein HY658_08750 [Actinobacteria bacterium]|nr:hypothetical protein [Actinomycetota bacterium]